MSDNEINSHVTIFVDKFDINLDDFNTYVKEALNKILEAYVSNEKIKPISKHDILIREVETKRINNELQKDKNKVMFSVAYTIPNIKK